MKLWMCAAILICGVGFMGSCNGNADKATEAAAEDTVAVENENPVVTAVDRYLVDSIGKHYAPGEMCIPCATVVACDQWTTDSVVDSVVVLGDFWVFNFNVVGDTLKTVSGGDHPGKMCLKKNEKGEFEVISFEQVEDGHGNEASARRIFGDMYEAFHGINSDQETREQARGIAIARYVRANKLPVKFYQDYGWPAKEIPAE